MNFTSQARYLKHIGKVMDVKVTIKILNNSPVIYVRDYEFHSFSETLFFLRSIAETELVLNRAESVR